MRTKDYILGVGDSKMDVPVGELRIKRPKAPFMEQAQAQQPSADEVRAKAKAWKPDREVANLRLAPSVERPKEAANQEIKPTTGFYEDFYRKTSNYKELTPEEEERENKRRKRAAVISAIGDGITAISNLYFTTQGAPNVKQNPGNSLSDKNRERWARLDAERKANRERYNAGLMHARKMDQDEASALREWRNKLAQQQEDKERWNRKFDADENDRKVKNGIAAGKNVLTAKGMLLNDAREKDKHNENVRHNKAMEALGRHRNSIEISRIYNNNPKNKYVTFMVDGEEVKIPSEKMNDLNVYQIYQTIPFMLRGNVAGEPVYKTDKRGRKVIAGYGYPSRETMLKAIGEHMGSSRETRDALYKLAGKERQKPVSDNTPPSRRVKEEDKTPPSRRK